MRSRLWLTEGTQVQALCHDPAELITALCSSGIEAFDFRDLGESRYSFVIPSMSEEHVRQLGNRCGAEISVLRRRGFFHFLKRFRIRAYLLLIPLPFLLGFSILSTFLWQIDVVGNVTLSRGEILSSLENVGVYPGVSSLRLDNAQIRSRMQEALKKLSWCTVQVHGSRALVVVRERRQPPNVVDEHLACEVAAAKIGTIQELNVLEGKALVKKGDTVLKGQTLITGILSDQQQQVRQVHAMGRVMAWTWYETALVFPLQIQEKVSTGVEKKLCSLKIGDLRLNFYNDSSIPQGDYDKIYTEKRASLFGLFLPVSFLKTEYRAYHLVSGERSPEQCAAYLEERLLAMLKKGAPEAEILETWFRWDTEDGSIRASLLAQCREDIGTEREITSP